MLEQGDIYITELERGFYGAFRIIRKGRIEGLKGELYLISITSYIDTDKPKISDVRLLKPLCCNRFESRNKKEITLYTFPKKLTKHFEYLGNIPTTPEENKMIFDVGDGRSEDGGYPLRGPLEENIGIEAFYEWRWEHENEEFINEVNDRNMLSAEKQVKAQAERKEKAVFMDDSTFWSLISLVDWYKKSDSLIIKPVVEALAKMSVEEIISFEETFSYKLYLLNTKEHARHSGDYTYDKNTGYVSSDLFLYARALVVAEGESFYEMVIKHPSLFPKTHDFEPMLYIASNAYKKKTRKEFDHLCAYDYETFSNESGWG